MRRHNNRPRVSVIIPIHGQRTSLLNAVQSVLGQTYSDFELLIVDDGSGLDVTALLRSRFQDARIRVVRHAENRGAGASRNTGVASSTGDYIAFLDSDDVWSSTKLDAQLRWMNSPKHQTCISCTGYLAVTDFNPNGDVRIARPKVKFRDLLWGCGISPGSTMIVHRSLFEVVGSFDESLQRMEDWDWLLRCAQLTPVTIVPQVLATVHGTPRDDYPIDAVENSASIIRGYISDDRYPLSARQRRRMLSTLHAEVAAAHFRRRRYGTAAVSMARSLSYQPFRRSVAFRRILRALARDLFGSRSSSV